MAEFPAMPFWTDAYLGDTGHLTTLEHGAYFLLLMAMWRSGGTLPHDDKQLSRYARLTMGQWRRIKPTMMGFFVEEQGVITQKRLLSELDYVRGRKRSQQFNGISKWHRLDKSREGSLKRSERLSEARRKGNHSPEEWSAMRIIFGKCVRCGAPEMVKDHITPICLGGSDALTNIQPLCTRCNSSKGPDNTDHRWQCRQTWLEEISNRLGYNPLETHDGTPAKWLPNGSQMPAPTPIPKESFLEDSALPTPSALREGSVSRALLSSRLMKR